MSAGNRKNPQRPSSWDQEVRKTENQHIRVMVFVIILCVAVIAYCSYKTW